MDINSKGFKNEFNKELNKGFELDQITVTEELIQRTLKAVEQGDCPRISDTLQEKRERRQKRNKKILTWSKRTAGAAAVVLVFFLCSKLTDLSGSKKEMAMDSEQPASLYSDENAAAGLSQEETAIDAAQNEEDKVSQEELYEGTGEIKDGATIESAGESKNIDFLELIPDEIKKMVITGPNDNLVLVDSEDTNQIKKYVDLMNNTKMTYEQADLSVWSYKIILTSENERDYSEIYICQNQLYVVIIEEENERIMSYQLESDGNLIEQLQDLMNEE